LVTAAVQVLTQKGSAILWILGSAVWMLAGAMFPISALPRWLQLVALAIPMTHALKAMRLALFGAGWPAGLANEIAILAGFAVLFLPLGLIVFERALREARMSGSLSHY
jgi:ABC-2 type transport system permease protein